ncbi:hypothetical protein X975_00037, partial [Stegodyphus mimosarum]
MKRGYAFHCRKSSLVRPEFQRFSCPVATTPGKVDKCKKFPLCVFFSMFFFACITGGLA